MSQEQDKIFFRNFTVVLVVLAGMMLLFMVLGVVFGDLDEVSADANADVIQNTQPVGQVHVAGKPTEEAMASEDAAEISESAVAATDAMQAADAGDAMAAGEAGGAANAMEGADAQAMLGKNIYDSACMACHSSGIPNIPQLGDVAAWAPRIEQGNELLYEHAINGYIGTSGMPMPARGGNPSLSDEEVKAAVDYMVANSR